MHSGKEAPLHHVNDVSLAATSGRAKQYLPFLQRGRTAGVVDFVITGHRLKVHACLHLHEMLISVGLLHCASIHIVHAICSHAENDC